MAMTKPLPYGCIKHPKKKNKFERSRRIDKICNFRRQKKTFLQLIMNLLI